VDQVLVEVSNLTGLDIMADIRRMLQTPSQETLVEIEGEADSGN